MLRKIAIVIGLLLLALVGYIATRPDTFRIERSAVIAAPPQAIYPQIADFHAWPAWSPWEKIDPNLTRTYSGSPSGAGAVYAWEGNSDVGSGRMEILEETPPSRVFIKLDFLTPFEAHNTAEFTLTETEKGTQVTWAMVGPNTTMGKVMGLFLDMDEMIGSQFATGLANLKAQAE
jgi:uncharacterized protein YndB with AHSA1/START domain